MLLTSEVDPALEHAGIRALAALMTVEDLLGGRESSANDRLRSCEVRAANYSQIDGSGPAADRATYSVRLVSLASSLGLEQPMTRDAVLFGLDLIPERSMRMPGRLMSGWRPVRSLRPKRPWWRGS